MARSKSVRNKRSKKTAKKRSRRGIKRRNRKGAKKSCKSQFSIALRRLKKLKSHQRHQAMSIANDGFIRQFCSKVRKLKHAKIPTKSRKALQKHKKKLQKLLRKQTTVSQQRAMLSQRGGAKVNFLDVVVAALPFLAAAL